MELQITKTDVYFVLVGNEIDANGRAKPHRFELGQNPMIAKQRLQLILDEWSRQPGLWTEEGLNRARSISKGQKPQAVDKQATN